MTTILTLSFTNETTTIPMSVSLSDDDAARIIRAYAVMFGPTNVDGTPTTEIDIINSIGKIMLGNMLNTVHLMEQDQARAEAVAAALAGIQPIVTTVIVPDP